MSTNKSSGTNQYYKDWFDWWLDDVQPSEADKLQLQQVHSQHLAAAKPIEQAADDYQPKYLTLNLSLPKPSLSNLSKSNFNSLNLQKLVSSKFGKAALAVCASLLIISVGYGLVGRHGVGVVAPPETAASKALATAGGSAISVSRTYASFKPVAPIGKPQLANYAAGQTTYDGLHDMYTYDDTFQGAPLTVSQHAVTSQYTSATDAVTKIAAQIGATNKIQLTNGTAYLKTDPVSNAQDIILSVRGILLYVDSKTSHSPADWQVYLVGLQ
ncbi:MAG TPA: hypothetical protein VMT23_02385 [Candidatus Binatia bacterium]|nr:hypothetical protein [Candidatus Binatia bacterium]